jgi:hypothetical protein
MANSQESTTKPGASSPRIGEVIIRGGTLAISCVTSYWLITRLLAKACSVSRDDD